MTRETLTIAQEEILRDLKSLPARKRHGGRAGGSIPATALAHYDRRSLSGLFAKGILTERLCDDVMLVTVNA